MPIHPDTTLFMLGDIALYSTGPALLLFVVFYFAGSRWRSTLAGRAVMYLAMSLTVTIGLAIVTAVLGPNWPGRGWVRLTVYLGVSFAVWRLFITLLVLQHRTIVDPLRPIRPNETMPPAKPHASTRPGDQLS